MSEWWTYRLSDFLLFSPDTYYRLFELYHRRIWPLQLLAITIGGAILVLSLRRDPWRGRMIAALLAAAWLWAGVFLLEYYATINWAARWFAAGFALQAVLLIWTGVFRNRFAVAPAAHAARQAGFALFLFALIVSPFIAPMAGRPWAQAEIFGATPDPTAIATMGIIIFLSARMPLWLLIIPLLWCGVSGATFWAMGAPDALVLPIAAAVAILLMIWRMVRTQL